LEEMNLPGTNGEGETGVQQRRDVKDGDKVGVKTDGKETNVKKFDPSESPGRGIKRTDGDCLRKEYGGKPLIAESPQGKLSPQD